MRAIIRSFNAFLLAYLKQQQMHKANVWGKFIYIPIQSLAICIIWYVISEANPHISYLRMVSYYAVCAIMTASFPYARHTRDVQECVFSGNFSSYEVHPGGYFLSRFSFFYSWIAVYSLVAIPSLFALVYICNYPNNLFSVVTNAVLFYLLGTLLTFIQWSIIADLSFWIKKIIGIVKVNYTIISFFSGSLVPYAILPDQFKALFDVMPFKYSAYFTARIVTEGMTVTNCLPDLYLLLAYLTAFSLLHAIIFYAGRRQYNGGFH